MILECRAVPPFEKNGFVLGCEQTHEAVIIDPGDEVQMLLDIVRGRQLQVKQILLTHGHVDHVSGVARAKRELNVPVHMHRGDLPLYENAVAFGEFFGLKIEPPPPIDIFYQDEAEKMSLAFGTFEIHVHHTPGHCPGGVCLQVGPAGAAGKQLFVGDTLFAGSIGRTDLPGGDYATLMRSIRRVLFAFGDDAEVYPGHGPKTTIGHERATNPFLRDERRY
jgi:glyoxylase-like metal-dependent hydrolase (beta-lactamase superfamily II)